MTTHEILQGSLIYVQALAPFLLIFTVAATAERLTDLIRYAVLKRTNRRYYY